MRISDWSSDVCSSDLQRPAGREGAMHGARRQHGGERPAHAAEKEPVVEIAEHHRGAPRRARHGGQHRRLGTAFAPAETRSEEHTSELQSLMRNSYAVFCLKKKYDFGERIGDITRLD